MSVTTSISPIYDEAWFLDKFLAALPNGPAWNKEPGSAMYQALASLMGTYVRVAEAAGNMIVDSFPATTVNLLNEWQWSTGLPDPCLGQAPTLLQEQGQIVARLISNGGQSLAYFESLVNALGYQCSITTFRPTCANIDVAGRTRLLPAEACNWLLISLVPAASQNTVIECELASRARATTLLGYVFGYGVAGSALVPTGTNVSTYNANAPLGIPGSTIYATESSISNFSIGASPLGVIGYVPGDFSTQDFSGEFFTGFTG